MTGSGCFKKAELIAEGIIEITEGLRLPQLLSCSSSGPDAGSYSIVVGFDGHRLKIPVSRSSGSAFSLVQDNEGFQILRNGQSYIDKVQILPCRFHAPEQAFIDLSEGCVLDCAFCAVPRLKRPKRRPPIDRVMEIVLEAGRSGQIKAVALTSGVGLNPSDIIEEMVSVVGKLKGELPIPVGLEPYVETRDQIESLYRAGADEIKINIHSWNRGIFARVCPQWNFERTIDMIEAACDIFGRGNVTSNIIFGLGEGDGDVLDGIEYLSRLGCIPTLRKLRVNNYNSQVLTKVLGEIPNTDTERIVTIARGHKAILERHNLNPLRMKTMCHPCGCCDLVPFLDI